MNVQKKFPIVVVAVIVAVLVIGLGIAFAASEDNDAQDTSTASSAPQNNVAVSSYEECADAGYPVLESYPEQCTSPDGQVFIRQLSAEELQEETENNNI